MKITYDQSKNDKNIAERGLSFEQVVDLEWESALRRIDTRKDYGELRIRILAYLDGRLHVAVITPRHDEVMGYQL